MQLKSQMYPLNSNNGTIDPPISYSDQPFFHRPFLNDLNPNPNSKHEQDPLPPLSTFFHFPSLFEDDLFFHHQSITETTTMAANNNMDDFNKNHISNLGEQIMNIPRKRSSKRDRHSKINTARGPRDRRMRLSLKVAPDFFGLQELLGYDTASRTVEWLLIKSKDEIKKLEREKKRSSNCASSTFGAKTSASSASGASECEVVSGIIDEGDQQGMSTVSEEKDKPISTKEKRIRLRQPQSRKSAFNPLAKESREKARARARERTRAKANNNNNNNSNSNSNNSMDLTRLGSSWSPFETGEESAGTQSQSQNMNTNPSLELEVLPEAEEGSSHARGDDRLGGVVDDMVINDDYLVITAKWSPSIFNSLHNNVIPQEVSSKKNQVS